MKKILLSPAVILAFAAVLALSSCSKPITVAYNIDEYEACLPQNVNQHYETYSYVITQAKIKAAVEATGAKWDLNRINTAGLKKMDVVVSTTGLNLDNIASVELYIKDATTTGDGEQIAYASSLGTGATQATLSINGKQLKTYLSKDQFTFFVKVLNHPTNGTPVPMCVKLKSGVIEVEVKND